MALNNNFKRIIVRVKKSCVFSVLMPISLFIVVIRLSESQQIRTVCVSDSVLLSCKTDQQQMRRWEHENQVLFSNKLKIDFVLNQIELLANYSLVIHEVKFGHEGTYRCLQNGSIVAEFELQVEVPPKLFLTRNGADNVTYLNVEAGTDVTLFCHAVGAIPPANLSWTIDDENVNHRELNFTVGEGGEIYERQVFDSVSVHRFKLIHDNGVISCSSKSTHRDVGIREISLKYHTFVSPDLSITVDDVTPKSEVHILANKPTIAKCHASGSRPVSNLFWFINKLPLNDSNHFNESIIEKNNSFDTVSSVNFTPKKPSGFITCVSKLANGTGSYKKVDLKFYTYMIPQVQIFINGIVGIDNVPVDANEPVRVVCNASSFGPRFNVSLLVNNVPIESLGEINETSSFLGQYDTTFYTVSAAWHRPKDTNGSITCKSYLNSTEVGHDKATYVTYVVPDMYFIIDGSKWKNVSTITVTANQMVTVACQANGARPAVQLMWKLNRKNIDTQSVSIRNVDNQTLNISTTLEFQSDESARNITCFTRGLFDRNIFILAYVQVVEPDKPPKTDIYQYNNQLWKTFVIVLVLLLIAVPSTMFILRRYFGGRSSYSLHPCQARENIETCTSTSVSGDHQREHGLKGLELPEVPGGTETSDYCPFTEDDYDSYFELKDKPSRHRMFRGKDMCLILSMNSGNLQRWMGTISPSIYHKICVVFSTVRDNALKKGEIQWDTYVKRVLDMPDHNSLVKLEGVCVNQANLYLVHEHLTCDSLESIISSKRTTNNRHGPLATSEVATYLRDILEGMEVLHSFGFLHPGLSTRKVLVTDKGHCKLYDFFLAEDAPNKTSSMKSTKDCSISDLPPEALLRNEYTQASDVWCIAVVLWNLMSYDPIPIGLQNLDERKVSNVAQEWPSYHLKLKNHILFECWMYDEEFRPSINKLRSSFQKVFENTQTFPSSVDLKETTTDLYIPMDGTKAANQQKSDMDGGNFSLEIEQNILT